MKYIELIDDNGVQRKAVSVKDAAKKLKQTLGTIQLYLTDGRLEGKMVSHKSSAPTEQFVFNDSIEILSQKQANQIPITSLKTQLPECSDTSEMLTLLETAVHLNCGKSAIRKYLRKGLLIGCFGFDPEINNYRIYVSVESVKNFQPETNRRGGRPVGVGDQTIDRTRRQTAGKLNGRRGGLANQGIKRKRRTKAELLLQNKQLTEPDN